MRRPWTRWENTIERKVTWAGRGTLEHILSCCPKALGEGRYRWRHDQVLKSVAEAIAPGIESAKRSRPSKQTIAFVRAGEQPRRTSKTSAGILTTAKDWRLLVDLEKQLKFPNDIAATTLRPDIVLVSDSTKQVVLLELTVPWEDRLEEALKRKLFKYTGLVNSCQQAGWRARCLPVEVGCRGFAARSLARALSTMDIEGERERRAIRSTKAAESIKMAVAQEGREVEEIVARHLDTSWGLISPSWVTWRKVHDVERPETPDDPWLHH